MVKLSTVILPYRDISYLDPSKNGSLIYIVIASIDNTFGVWPSFLCCSDCCPKDSLSPTTGVTEYY